MKTCAYPDCGRPTKAMNLCNGHDLQRRKKQELRPLSKHSLSADERFWFHVQKTATCWLWTGAKDRHGYGKVRINAKSLAAHRVSFERANGPIPNGKLLDHTCHAPSCVNPSHLRLATTKQNMENMAGPQKGSRSGARGVSWHEASKGWTARVVHNGQKYYLGTFKSIEEADAVVVAKRLELYTHNLADRKLPHHDDGPA